mgnify:CR=1 FL=1
MDLEKINKIKTAVRRNFEASPLQYDEFESKYCFFEKLNSALLEQMNQPGSRKILDVGCGTGASCMQLVKACPKADVYGLDNSAAMLEKAKEKYCDCQRLSFVEGDAAALQACLNHRFDTIIYSASIFLIPDYQESLRQAYELLESGGKIGLTFMDGVFSSSGADLFRETDKRLNLGISLKKPVKLEELEACIKAIFKSVQVIEKNLELPRNVVRDFFSIPAMSAGLFPALDYALRLEKISTLFDNIAMDNVIFRWIMIIAEK